MLILGACPIEEASIDDDASETGVAPGDGDGDPSTTGDGDGDGDGDDNPTPDMGDGDPPQTTCGDGVVDPDETCDDGNLVSGDGCASGCSLEGLVLPCGDKVYACGDGLDNDGDGKVDSDDGECISPCDDNEASFQTDLPGAGEDCKADCYFDENSGGGNDACEWYLQCDPQDPGAQVGCGYDPDSDKCNLELPPECVAACEPLVPNDCDCFGCCEIAGAFYYLDSSPECSFDNLEACESCTFHEGCNNPCEPENCELCFGQDPSELPPGCTPNCNGGQQCLGSADCQEGWFCQTGCCLPTSIP